MRKRWYIAAAIVVVLLSAGFAVIHDRSRINIARTDLSAGRYAEAEHAASSVWLLRSEGSEIAADVRRQQALDDSAWSAFHQTLRPLSSAISDKTSPSVPDALSDQTALAIRDVLLRPSSFASSDEALQRQFAKGLPNRVAIIVNTVADSQHHARLVRFAISSGSDYVKFPMEDHNRPNCMGAKGMDCWDFMAIYANLFVMVPRQSNFATDHVYRLTNQDLGTFGAAELTWTNGIALVAIGSIGQSYGGNAGDTWWHVWRVSSDSNTTLDTGMRPFDRGAYMMSNDTVKGEFGFDTSVIQTPFDECHACAHIRRAYTAAWNAADGRFVVQSTEIEPSPYATLVRYINTFGSGTDMLDSSANPQRLEAFRTFVHNLQAGGYGQCSVLSQGDNPSTALVAELRFSCPLTPGYIAIKAVRHGSAWYLADLYPAATAY